MTKGWITFAKVAIVLVSIGATINLLTYLGSLIKKP